MLNIEGEVVIFVPSLCTLKKLLYLREVIKLFLLSYNLTKELYE